MDALTHDTAAPPVGHRLLPGLAFGYGSAGIALALAFSLRVRVPVIGEAVRCGVFGVALATVLLAFTGTTATVVMLRARRRGRAVGRTARWPQITLVVPLAILAALIAWRLRPAAGPALVPGSSQAIIGGAAIVLCFPLLVVERMTAALPALRLPEAVGLRALVLLPVLLTTLAGLGEIAAGLGAGGVGRVAIGVSAVIAGLVAVELAARAAARGFLPPPAPESALAAVQSSLARLIAEGVRERSLTTPVRSQFGIDFSRSFALAYARSAALPLIVFLLVVSWGLSGLALVGYDQRAVYERFGAPVGVLQPGLHAILPWPLGQTRVVEFGAVHEVPLADATLGPADRVTAEAAPPPSLDRLWEQAHPAEASFLIASEADGRQSFQTVAADVRVQWRVGLSDAAALDAAYRNIDPEPLVRAAASRAVARALAGRTLDEVLGEKQDGFAAMLRASVQADLDAARSGVEIVAIVVESIHPPAGAAESYHAVQAAEINANARVASERGRAAATRAQGQEYAADSITQAQAVAAETVGLARGDAALFAADRDGAAAGREVFVLERYYDKIAAALSRVPTTLIDSRIAPADAPVLDLRPPGAPGAVGAAPPVPD
jgi:regulator of protease activity HflC (stomatin/prohibitin superfamily)